MIKRLFLVLLVVLTVFTFACQGKVTETGNPYDPPQGVGGGDGDQGGGDGDPPPAGSAPDHEGYTYTNDTFGVSIGFPSTWYYTTSDGVVNSVRFADYVAPYSIADFTFISYSAGVNLLNYLNEKYPTKTFTNFNTDSLSGYMYDNPVAGESGGDLKEYYFVNGTTLVQIVAEIFSEDAESFGELLNGISIE